MRLVGQVWQPFRGTQSGFAGILVATGRCSRKLVVTDATSSRNKALGHIDPAYRNDVAGIIDKADASLDLWTPTYTDFFPPPVTATALAVLKGVAVTAGGFLTIICASLLALQALATLTGVAVYQSPGGGTPGLSVPA